MRKVAKYKGVYKQIDGSGPGVPMSSRRHDGEGRALVGPVPDRPEAPLSFLPSAAFLPGYAADGTVWGPMTVLDNTYEQGLGRTLRLVRSWVPGAELPVEITSKIVGSVFRDSFYSRAVEDAVREIEPILRRGASTARYDKFHELASAHPVLRPVLTHLKTHLENAFKTCVERLSWAWFPVFKEQIFSVKESRITLSNDGTRVGFVQSLVTNGVETEHIPSIFQALHDAEWEVALMLSDICDEQGELQLEYHDRIPGFFRSLRNEQEGLEQMFEDICNEQGELKPEYRDLVPSEPSAQTVPGSTKLRLTHVKFGFGATNYSIYNWERGVRPDVPRLHCRIDIPIRALRPEGETCDDYDDWCTYEWNEGSSE